MTRLLLGSILAVGWMVAACWAAAAIDSKTSPINIAAETAVNGKEREGHALRAGTDSYLTAPAPALAPVLAASAPSPPAGPPAPIPHPIHGNAAETTMGYVYYYLPTVERYYPKLKDLMPYFRSLRPIARRAWPAMRQAADRTLDIGSAFGLVILAPALLISSVLFLVFIVFLLLFPAVSAFGKRRMGRDLSGIEDPDSQFDFEQFLPPEQSRKLAVLAATVDGYLEAYKRSLTSDSCLQKFSCEAGLMTNRLGRIVEPIVA